MEDDVEDDDPIAPLRDGIERRLRQLIASDSAVDMNALCSMVGLFAGQATFHVAGLAGERMGIIGMEDAGDRNIEAAAHGLASLVRVAMQMAVDADDHDRAEAEE